jgi:hypothetical protein
LVEQQTSKGAQVKPRETTREIKTLVELSGQNRPDRFLETRLTGLGTDTVQRLVGLKTGLTGLAN